MPGVPDVENLFVWRSGRCCFITTTTTTTIIIIDSKITINCIGPYYYFDEY